MKGRLFLDVVVRKSATVLELLAGEDQSLLVRGDTFLILDLGFDIVNSVGRLNFQGDSFASERLNKNLHATTETKHKMESRLFLDVVIRKGTAIFQLLSREDESLLVGWDTANEESESVNDIQVINVPFLVLDLILDCVDRVGRFDLKSDGLASQSLDKDLHDSTHDKAPMSAKAIHSCTEQSMRLTSIGSSAMGLLCEDVVVVKVKDRDATHDAFISP